MIGIDNKSIVCKFYDALNTGDISEIHRYIAEDYEEIHDGIRYPIGLIGAKEHLIGIRRVYPDIKFVIENQISEGEWVATSYKVTGTFQQEWLGIKPTGKIITYTGVNVDRLKDGKIIEHGGAANLLFPLLEAGVIEKKE